MRKKKPLGQSWPRAGSCWIQHLRCPFPLGAWGLVAGWVPPVFPGDLHRGQPRRWVRDRPARTLLGGPGGPLPCSILPGRRVHPWVPHGCRAPRHGVGDAVCGRRGAAARARPGSLPNQSLCRCFACALETRSPRSQVCAFGACGGSTKSLGTAKMPAGWLGVSAAPSQAAEPHLSCLRGAPKNHDQSPPPWPWSNMTFPL